jgi:trigger factor
MKTSVERESPTKVRLLVEVEPSEIERLTSDTVKKLSQEFKVPGFRKGKVPRQILESRIGKDAIRQRMLEDSLPRLYTDATKEEALRPVATPDIEVTDFDGDTLTFTATVEVRPDVHLPNYKDLEIERPTTLATREEIDDRLEVLRKRFATLEPVSRNAEAGDNLLIDVMTSIHDQKIDEATANDLMYELGSATLAPELDTELTGKRAGDIVKFNTTLPERLSAEYGGKEVTMTVIVKEVNAKRLPDFDDDFAKTASEFDTLEELEREIRERIEEYKGVQADREVQNRLLDELIDLADVPVPESLVDDEAKVRMESLLQEVRQHGMSLTDYLEVLQMNEEELRAAQRRAAERSIGADFLLDEIAKTEGMNVTRAELDEEVERLSKRVGKTPEEFRRDVIQAGRVEALAGDILRRKVLNYLVEQATITDEATAPAEG